MRQLAFPLLAALFLTSIASAHSPTATDIPQPNVVYSIRGDGAGAVAAAPVPLPDHAFSDGPTEPPLPLPPARRPDEKIHPELRAMAATLGVDEMVEVMIGFADDLVLPRFPEPVVDQPMDSLANLARMNEAEGLIGGIREQRDRIYENHIQALGPNVTVLERFWITPTLLVRMPLGEIAAIAQLEEVTTLEPRASMIAPPSCPFAPTGCQVDDGRFYIGSSGDPNGQGYGGGSVALLDTGVRPTHVQLAGRIGLLRDCVAGTSPGCTGGSQQPNDSHNHGTSSAAIISANANQGNQFRGMSVATINSFKVYPNGGGLDRPAVQRGFQAALANLDKVIVAEMQDDTGEAGTTTVAGDNAFNAGAVVIAANGNQGQVTGVGGPANGHRVIGTGARSLPSGNIAYQVNGPTSDGRIKPDLQAPTDTQTASAASDTALRYYAGTSGATPYMGGAAVQHRNRLLSLLGATSVHPGQVYARLIHYGTQPIINDAEGAGPVRISRFAWHHYFGSVMLTTGQQVDIPVNICGANFFVLAGALWWPENAASAHRRVQLSLVDPSGVTRVTGSHPTSVFQKAEMTSGIVSGIWKVRIKVLSGPSGSQQVFWSAGYNSYIGCGWSVPL